MVPVDLNAILYKVEADLAYLHGRHGDPAAAAKYTALARARKMYVAR